MITVRFSTKNSATTVAEIDRDDVVPVLEACRRRVFPGVEPPLRDAVWERALARVKDRRKPTPDRDC
jgi:hypothetical protein